MLRIFPPYLGMILGFSQAWADVAGADPTKKYEYPLLPRFTA
jgi:hypothetical protein